MSIVRPSSSLPIFRSANIRNYPVEAEILAAMNQAGTPPEFAYAFRETGLLGLSSDKSRWPRKHIKEWNAAVDEYRAIKAASKRPDRPDPKEWHTKIPELLIAPFTQADFDQVRECLRSINPIEARGMKLVTRIEPAAACQRVLAWIHTWRGNGRAGSWPRAVCSH